MKKTNLFLDLKEAKELFGERALLSMDMQSRIVGGDTPPGIDSVCLPQLNPALCTIFPTITEECTCPLPKPDPIPVDSLCGK